MSSGCRQHNNVFKGRGRVISRMKGYARTQSKVTHQRLQSPHAPGSNAHAYGLESTCQTSSNKPQSRQTTRWRIRTCWLARSMLTRCCASSLSPTRFNSAETRRFRSRLKILGRRKTHGTTANVCDTADKQQKLSGKHTTCKANVPLKIAEWRQYHSTR